MKTLTGQNKLTAGNTIHLPLKVLLLKYVCKRYYIRLCTHICKNKIEAFFLSFCTNLFLNNTISNQNKVHLNTQMKFTSRVNISLLSVSHLACFFWHTYGILRRILEARRILPRQTNIWKFSRYFKALFVCLVIYFYLSIYYTISRCPLTCSTPGAHCSMSYWHVLKHITNR